METNYQQFQYFQLQSNVTCSQMLSELSTCQQCKLYLCAFHQEKAKENPDLLKFQLFQQFQSPQFERQQEVQTQLSSQIQTQQTFNYPAFMECPIKGCSYQNNQQEVLIHLKTDCESMKSNFQTLQSLNQQELLQQIKSLELQLLEIKKREEGLNQELQNYKNQQIAQSLLPKEEKQISNLDKQASQKKRIISFKMYEENLNEKLELFSSLIKPENITSLQSKALASFYGLAIGDSWGHLYEFKDYNLDQQLIISLSPQEFKRQ